MISLHRRQLQLQAGHLGHQLQLLGLQSRAGQQLLTAQSLLSSALVTAQHKYNLRCEKRLHTEPSPSQRGEGYRCLQFCWLQEIRHLKSSNRFLESSHVSCFGFQKLYQSFPGNDIMKPTEAVVFSHDGLLLISHQCIQVSAGLERCPDDQASSRPHHVAVGHREARGGVTCCSSSSVAFSFSR